MCVVVILTEIAFLDVDLRPQPIVIKTNKLLNENEKKVAHASAAYPSVISNTVALAFVALISIPAIKKQAWEDQGNKNEKLKQEIEKKDVYNCINFVKSGGDKKLFELFSCVEYRNARQNLKRDCVKDIMMEAINHFDNEIDGLSTQCMKRSATPPRPQPQVKQPGQSGQQQQQTQNNNNNNNYYNNNNNYYNNNNNNNNSSNSLKYFDYSSNLTNKTNKRSQFLSPGVPKARSVSPINPRHKGTNFNTFSSM